MSTSELGNGAGNSGDGSVTWDPLSEIDHTTIVQGCSCALCQGLLKAESGARDATSKGGDPTDANPDGLNIGQLLPLGTNPDGSHFFTGIRNVDATLIGSKWGSLNLTFSFPTTGSNYNGPTFDSNGVSLYHIDLGAQQQAAARAAFGQISAATGLTFTEITDTDTVHANIRVSQTADQEVGSAYGNFPSDTKPVAGDIWFGRTSQPYYDLASKGTWGFSTMLHEIGHTMGLKHGHQDYTNSDLSFYFGTAPRFGTQSLTPDRDGQAWSLMTYTPAPFTNSGFAGEKINQPQTYMQYDLAALQYMYGANYTTNSGDSTYTFSLTTGEMFINGVGQGAPSGNKIFLTIWDGGGNDTIDVSNYATGVTVDLRPGEYSTVDAAQLANSLAYQNLVSLAPGNFAMSLLYNNDGRSLIENVKGGAGNDVFVGNTANNIFDGGAGNDGVIFTGATGVTVTLNDSGADVVVTHDGETDTLRNIENVGGTGANDTLTGNSLDNILNGGTGGADTLSGGGGNDRLIGGGFTTTTTVSAPSQPDITKPASTNNGSIATAVATAGFYDVDANPDITSATTLPHATINATATGGTLEYYRIDVTVAGSQAIFDIDGGGSLDDSIIELVNSAGTQLATNDTGTGDASFPGHDDAYLAYTFATAGTYYIRVGRYISTTVAQPLLAGQTYQLNISLQNAAVVTTTVTANNTSSVVADGGEGNDFLQGTIANDTLTGGNGSDTASFANAFSGGSTTGVTVNLNTQGVAQNTVAAGMDTLSGIENLIGSQLNDTLIGSAEGNIIEGGLGDDTLSGGGGNDTASYASAEIGVTVSLGLQGAAQATGGAGSDTLSGFENLLGSAFNDNLTGNAGENLISGGAGDDTLNPGANTAGNVDLLDGGIGSDTASFAGLASAVTATLSGPTDGVASVGGVQIASLRSIENLTGGDGADTLTGDANANVIEGGLGDDVLDGGLGVDTVSFRGATGVTLDLSIVTAQATGYGSDTITNFENVRTGSGADTITGNGADNIFFDGGGTDTYNGAAGADTVDYTNITATLAVNLNTVTAQAVATGSDILSGIENVTGSLTASNTLTGGNGTANRLVGGAGQDFLIGNGLSDTLIGGAGTDVIFGDYVNTFSTTAGTADGADILEGGAGNDQLVGGLGNDILRGGDGDDLLAGGIANGTILGLSTVYTNDGGDDTYDGGDGTDIAYAYYTDHTGGIAFDLGNLAGNSAITVAGVAAGAFISVERVIFRGSTVADTVRGGGTLDTLVGNAGDDTLDGWYGNDTLSGGAGNDSLIGGEGLDTATYVNATAGVNVDLRITVAQDTGGEGIDTLSSIEYLTGSTFGDTLRGDDDFNLLIDNTVAATVAFTQTDSLYGYGGNDSILVTRAAAAVATTILMDGGDGDDLIQLASGTVTLNTDANGNSADPVGLSSGALYAAPGRAGTRALDNVTVNAGTGNDRVVLTGVDAAVIDLGTGNDVLSISTLGAVGFNDHDITTGAGQDTIQFAGSGAVATTTVRANIVRDFTVGDTGDRFELRTATGGTFAATSWVNTTNFVGLTSTTQDMFDSGHLRLLQSGIDLLFQVDRDATGAASSFVTVATLAGAYTGALTAFNFDGMIGALTLTGQGALNETLTGASKGDTLSGGDGNDLLIGLAGNDTLDGGNADDVLRGGLGDDVLTGGAGNDTASYSDATAAVTVSLALAGAQATGAGSDTLTDIENLIGSGLGDTLTGNAGDNALTGGAGGDTLIGGAGTDRALVADTVTLAAFSLLVDADSTTAGNQPGWRIVGATDGTDSLSGIEIVDGAEAGRILLVGNGAFADEAAAVAASTSTADQILFAGDRAVTATEDTTYVFGTRDFGFADLDGNSSVGVQLAVLPGTAVGQVRLNGVAVTAGQTIAANAIIAGQLTYVPAANVNGPVSFTFQLTNPATSAVSAQINTVTIAVASVEDAPVAVADTTASTAENATVTIAVLNNDTDVDGGAKFVATIAGTAATVGTPITLASGATATLNGDGTITYNPNGKFDALISAATAAATGASNSTATDSFSYSLNGNSTTTVTVTVTGLDGANDRLAGDSGNNTITGTSGSDVFLLQAGGEDTANGGDGNDAAYMGAALSAGDTIALGAGASDQLGLQGSYGSFGAGAVPYTFSASNIRSQAAGAGTEQIVLLSGSDTRFGDTAGALYSYNLKSVDANVDAGQQLVVSFNQLQVGENVRFDGSAETNGSFLTYGGLGTDEVIGGQQNDGFFFGFGAWGAGDRVDGQGGSFDQLALQGVYNVTFGANQFAGIEYLALLSGGDTRFGSGGAPYSYNLIMNDGNVAAGATFAVSANTLRADETLTFDGSAETNGKFQIFSGPGTDIIIGSQGADEIFGGAGADDITGGLGADLLNGGAGDDDFIYTAVSQSRAGEGIDQIRDFALGDRIDLSAIDANSFNGAGTNEAFRFVGSAAFSASGAGGAGELRAFATREGWRVEGDTDGNGIPDFTILVTISDAGTPLTAASFVL